MRPRVACPISRPATRSPRPRAVLFRGGQALVGLVGLVGLLVGPAACHFVADFDAATIERTEQKEYLFPQESKVKGWDLLVVLDTRDGSGLEALQDTVRGWVERLADSQMEVAVDPGPLPGEIGENGSGSAGAPQQHPIHVGFVSADLGVGLDLSEMPDVTLPPGCTWRGRRARLIHPPLARQGEAGFMHPFLVLHGREVANFQDVTGEPMPIDLPGAVAAFWDAVTAQPSTCPYQQPLAAATQALDYNLYNLGFLRADAALGVVVVTPDDDCSLADPYSFLYDWERNQPRTPSPLDCFAQGVTCDGADPLTMPGAKQNCRDLEYAPYDGPDVRPDQEPVYVQGIMSPAMEYAGTLMGLKGDKPVVLAAIAGPEGPVEVMAGPTPALQSTGECAGFSTHPGIRLKAFGEALGIPLYRPMCGGDLRGLLEEAINVYQNRSVVRCFPEPLMDQDLDAPGVQADCAVELVDQPGTADEVVQMTLEPCDATTGMNPWCWSLWDDPTCASGTSLSIDLMFDFMGETPVVGEVVRARCVMEKK